MANDVELPKPLFDTLENIKKATIPTNLDGIFLQDYQHAVAFLKSYDGSSATFNAYRREIERLLHWSWSVANKSVKEIRRTALGP